MATDSGKKLFVGPRFRRIRQQLGLSQTQIAEGLGISPSYINLIERNQRPVTAQILLRLAETYDLDLRDLADPQRPQRQCRGLAQRRQGGHRLGRRLARIRDPRAGAGAQRIAGSEPLGHEPEGGHGNRARDQERPVAETPATNSSKL